MKLEAILGRYRNLILTPRDMKERVRNRNWIRKVMEEGPSIEEIEIETVNRCNGVCPFCPVNVHEKQRPYAKMDTELFYSIIAQLAEMKYDRILSIYSNNEPFLDERIEEFYQYARKMLPKARLELFTNGSMLSLERFKNIIAYVDRFVIDNYNDDLTVNDNLKEIYTFISDHTEYKDIVDFKFRKQNEVIFSRGGQAPNKKNTIGIRIPCLLPYRQLIIRPTGEVSLCCNDALGIYTLGDLKEKTITEIWNSENYQHIREAMWKRGRRSLNLCRSCDTRTLPR